MNERVRVYLAEWLGTAAITTAVIGSGRMAGGLTRDIALSLLLNHISTILVLGLSIWAFAPISGAHFNPAVTLVMAVKGYINRGQATMFVVAQVLGALCGAVVANLMYQTPVVSISHTTRGGFGQILGEVVATAGLLFVILVAIQRSAQHLLPLLVPAWIGTALLFTSSTAFANPAITVGRVFSDSFAGIAPQSLIPFLIAQFGGAALGIGMSRIFTKLREDLHVVEQR